MRPVIGIAFDGTGYGLDGAIWGGEAMIADYRNFRRASHLQYLPLAGGDAAIRHPARIAATFLIALFGSMFENRVSALTGEEYPRMLATMVDRGINTVQTSSCGRLFDAVAALHGVRDEISYEAQAAIELETRARSSPPENHIYPCSTRDPRLKEGHRRSFELGHSARRFKVSYLVALEERAAGIHGPLAGHQPSKVHVHDLGELG